MAQRLPIIYVRGFAGGTSGINSAADDPFYGFNTGSTHVRVGAEGAPKFYQFESPMLRLLIEHGYKLQVNGSQSQLLAEAAPDTLDPDTVWIYRFYDRSADTFGAAAVPYQIEAAAQGLVDFLRLVLDRTKDAEQVYLVAHSMGGLVCRSAIQRYLWDPAVGPDPAAVAGGAGAAPDPGGSGSGASGSSPDSGKVPPPFPVSKVVTYATPHGGIDIELGGPVGDWFLETFGPNGSDIFTHGRMREYLMPDGRQDWTPPDGEWDPRVPYTSAVPAERYLSLVGTNPEDYEAARGWSARAVGVRSDGLVQIRNAYVKGSNRAYMHRCHSGRYGIVNSEEGYQNLRRFLFGNLKVALGLAGLSLETGKKTTWQADVALAIRGLGVLVHEQSTAHHCPVLLAEEAAALDTAASPVPLITTFLLDPGGARRYALNLRIFAVREERDFFLFGSHLEQIADWEDALLVDVTTKPDGSIAEARWQWNSTLPGPIAEAGTLANVLSWQHAEDYTPAAPSWVSGLPFPDSARRILGPDAGISMGIAAWT